MFMLLAIVMVTASAGEAAGAPPPALFTGPTGGNRVAPLSFDGSPSTGATSWAWNFGDGATATGAQVQHTYAGLGTFNVTLTVTGSGGSNSTTRAVLIQNIAPIAVAGPDVHETRITDVHLSGAASSDQDGNIASFAWNLGDGSTAQGLTVTHRYAALGDYVVTLRVTDNDGNFSENITHVGIVNVIPEASAIVPHTVDRGTSVVLDASASRDADGTINQYLWNFGDNTTGAGASVQHAYTTLGVLNVTLTVVDNDGAQATTTAPISVRNVPPVASFTPNGSLPLVRTRNVAFSLDGGLSYDPDGVSITNHTWTWGDGTQSYGPTGTHTYRTASPVGRPYNVTLTVRDADGDLTSKDQQISVVTIPPVAFINTPLSTQSSPETFTFDGSLSTPFADLTAFLWSFGDGATASGPVVEHKFAATRPAANPYTVTLTVTDVDHRTATASVPVVVEHLSPIPVPGATPASGPVGTTFTFGTSSTASEGATLVSFNWTFGDGTTGTGPAPTHSYGIPGRYRVTLTVTDSLGARATGTLNVFVLNSLASVQERAPAYGFADATSAAHMTWTHAGDPGAGATLLDTIGGGVCILDYDSDGFDDVFLVNSLYQDPNRNSALNPRSELFRNNGDGTLTPVGAATGANLQGFHMGCAVGDYDNDGNPDIYVTGYGAGTLLRNSASHTFTDATTQAGVANEMCTYQRQTSIVGSVATPTTETITTPCWGTSAVWLDYNADGRPDLYRVNYLNYSVANDTGLEVRSYRGVSNALFRNNGDGTFTDVTATAGVAGTHSASANITAVDQGPALGVAAGDFDRDGRVDIFIANDGGKDILYRNKGDGTFENVATLWGVADSRSGRGAAFGDINRDGMPDLAVSHGFDQYAALYQDQALLGIDRFTDVSSALNVRDTGHYSGWGVQLQDVNNDGWLDVLVANGASGHERQGGEGGFGQQNLLYLNDHGVRFVNATATMDHWGDALEVSRGLAAVDYDGDGFLDFVVVNNPDQPVRLLHSERGPGNFLVLKVQAGPGATFTKDALGAIVQLTADGATQRFEVGSGSATFLSQSSLRIHAGLGHATQADVQVTWPDGTIQTFTGLGANRFYTLTSGSNPILARDWPVVNANGQVGAGAASRSLVAAVGDTVTVHGSLVRDPLHDLTNQQYRVDYGDGTVQNLPRVTQFSDNFDTPGLAAWGARVGPWMIETGQLSVDTQTEGSLQSLGTVTRPLQLDLDVSFRTPLTASQAGGVYLATAPGAKGGQAYEFVWAGDSDSSGAYRIIKRDAAGVATTLATSSGAPVPGVALNHWTIQIGVSAISFQVNSVTVAASDAGLTGPFYVGLFAGDAQHVHFDAVGAATLAGPVTVFTEDFSAAHLAQWSPTTGPWSLEAGGVSVSSGSEASLWTPGSYARPLKANADLTFPAAPPGGSVGAGLYLATSAGPKGGASGYWFHHDGSAYKLERLAAGTATLLQSTTAALVSPLQVELTPTTVTFIAGATRLSAVDQTYAGPFFLGLTAGPGVHAHFGNAAVSVSGAASTLLNDVGTSFANFPTRIGNSPSWVVSGGVLQSGTTTGQESTAASIMSSAPRALRASATVNFPSGTTQNGGIALAQTGLYAEYFGDTTLTSLTATRIDPTVDFNFVSTPSPAGSFSFSARWTGKVLAPADGSYTFYPASDDGERLWIDGVLIVDSWVDQGETEHPATVSLSQGAHDVRLEYYANGAGSSAMRLRWSGPGIVKSIIASDYLVPAQERGYRLMATPSGGNTLYSVLRRDAGGDTSLGTYTASPLSGAQTWVVDLAPASITFSLNGQVVISVGSDTTYADKLRILLVEGPGATPTFDDVSVATVRNNVPSVPQLMTRPGTTNVYLEWTVPGDGGSPLTGYKLYRGTSSGSESLYQTLGLVTSYTDTGVSNGVKYYYKIAAVNALGDSSLSNEVQRGVCNGPANDCFLNQIRVTSLPYTNTQSISGSSFEAGEPAPCGAIQNTFWYGFTATTSGTVTVTTDSASTNFDTVLAAYRGTAVDGLALLACQDDNHGSYYFGLTSTISFAATAGEHYSIQLGGYNGATGTSYISISGVSVCDGPVHNCFADGVGVFLTPFSTITSNVGASLETGEPTACASPTRSVWYRFVAPASGTAVVTTDSSNTNYDTQLAAFSGSGLGSLTTLACNDDDFHGYLSGLTSYISFPCVAGQTYYIQLSGWNNREGQAEISITGCYPPAAASQPLITTLFSDGFPGSAIDGAKWSVPPAVDPWSIVSGAIQVQAYNEEARFTSATFTRPFTLSLDVSFPSGPTVGGVILAESAVARSAASGYDVRRDASGYRLARLDAGAAGTTASTTTALVQHWVLEVGSDAAVLTVNGQVAGFVHRNGAPLYLGLWAGPGTTAQFDNILLTSPTFSTAFSNAFPSLAAWDTRDLTLQAGRLQTDVAGDTMSAFTTSTFARALSVAADLNFPSGTSAAAREAGLRLSPSASLAAMNGAIDFVCSVPASASSGNYVLRAQVAGVARTQTLGTCSLGQDQHWDVELTSVASSFVVNGNRLAVADGASGNLYLGVWTTGLPVSVDTLTITRPGTAASVLSDTFGGTAIDLTKWRPPFGDFTNTAGTEVTALPTGESILFTPAATPRKLTIVNLVTDYLGGAAAGPEGGLFLATTPGPRATTPGYDLAWDRDANTYTLSSRNAALQLTTLATYAGPASPPNKVPVVLEISDTDLTLRVNGATLGTVADASQTGPFYAGLWVAGGRNLGFDDVLVNTAPLDVTHAYAANGIYHALYRITDAQGRWDEDDIKVVVGGVPPTAVIFGNATGTRLDTLSWSGATSFTEDGSTITGYAWTFGDGATASGATASHRYSSLGTFNVGLTVTSSNGRTATDSRPVVITNILPNGTAPPNFEGIRNTLLTFDGSASSDLDQTGTPVLTYQWNFGDGTVSANSGSPLASHAYANLGEYLVTLTVTDPDGGQTDPTSPNRLTVTILNLPPMPDILAPAGPVTRLNNQSFSVAALFRDDFSGGSLIRWEDRVGPWSFQPSDAPNVLAATTGASEARIVSLGEKPRATGTLAGADVNFTTAASTGGVYLAPDAGPRTGPNVLSAEWTGSTYVLRQRGPTGAIVSTATYSGAAAPGVSQAWTLGVNNGVLSLSVGGQPVGNLALSSWTTPARLHLGLWAGANSAVRFDNALMTGDRETIDLDGPLSNLAFLWTFDDGVPAAGQDVQHPYLMLGNRTVNLLAMELLPSGLPDENFTASAEAKVEVVNSPPVACGSLVSTVLGLSTLSAIVPQTVDGVTRPCSFDRDGLIISYDWELGDDSVASGPVVLHVYPGHGPYLVNLTVTDNDGATATMQFSVTNPNLPPIATASPLAVGTRLLPILLVGTGIDVDGTVTSWRWDFGDGTNDTGLGTDAVGSITTSHKYKAPGTYWTNLTITDDAGATAVASTNVTILNLLPIPRLNLPGLSGLLGLIQGQVNQLLGFDATGSFDLDDLGEDGEPLPLQFCWDFGDGNSVCDASGLISHSFGVPANFTITLTVIDASGGTANTTIEVKIANLLPIAIPCPPPLLETGLCPEALADRVRALLLDATHSEAKGAPIVNYTWTLPDGSQLFGATASKLFLTLGTYNVTLRVTDADGFVDESVLKVSVLNLPPLPDAGPLLNTDRLTSFLLNALGSVDPDGTIANVTWLLNPGNCNPLLDPPASLACPLLGYGTQVSVDPLHAAGDLLSNVGAHTITLRVTDSDGAVALADTTINVVNLLPVPNLGGDQLADRLTALLFDATNSIDPDNLNLGDPLHGIVMFRWDFGDSTWLQGTVDNSGGSPVIHWTSSDPNEIVPDTSLPTTSHLFTTLGNITVTLTVRDSDNAEASATVKIGVRNLLPQVNLPNLLNTDRLTQLLLDAVNYTTDPDNRNLSDPLHGIRNFTWILDDGTELYGPAVTHVFNLLGDHLITLRIVDVDGGVATGVVRISVANLLPHVSLLDLLTKLVNVNRLTDLTLGVTNLTAYDLDNPNPADALGGLVNFTWNFGDGTLGYGASVNHKFTSLGHFTITLTVRDPDGATASDSVQFDVLNLAPVPVLDLLSGALADPCATLLLPPDLCAQLLALARPVGDRVHPFLLTAANSVDPDGGVARIVWDFGDGSQSIGGAANHTFTQLGNFTITLTIVDNDGGSNTTRLPIHVANLLPLPCALPPVPAAGTGLLDLIHTFTLDGTCSKDPDLLNLNDPLRGITNFTWKVGDTVIASGPRPNVNPAEFRQVFNHLGSFVITLNVTDVDGRVATTTLTINLVNLLPLPTITLPALDLSLLNRITELVFSAVNSTDPDNLDPNDPFHGIVNVTWDFGDGTTVKGSAASLPSVPHVFRQLGTFTINLTVEDKNGALASVSTNLVITNMAPIPDLSLLTGLIPCDLLNLTNLPDPFSLTNCMFNRLKPVAFSAAASVDPDDIDHKGLTFLWDFGDSGRASGETAEHLFHELGQFNVTLTVVDADGATTTTRLPNPITIENLPPVPNLADVFGDRITSLKLDAGASLDLDGDVVNFAWKLNGRTLYDGPNDFFDISPVGVVENFTNINQPMVVSLIIRDSDGHETSAGLNVTVKNLLPALELPKLSTLVFDILHRAQGTVVNLLANVSDLDNLDASNKLGSITNATWEITNQTGAVAQAYSPAFCAPNLVECQIALPLTVYDFGDLNYKLTVTDENGGSVNASQVVKLLSPPIPKLNVDLKDNVTRLTTLLFDCLGSTDPDNTSADPATGGLSCAWNFANATNNITGPSVPHQYGQLGNQTTQLAVTDSDGNVVFANLSIDIQNSNPSLKFTKYTRANLHENVFWDGSQTKDPDTDQALKAVYWDFTDAPGVVTRLNGSTVRHAFASLGPHEVTFTAVDADNGIAFETWNVTVVSDLQLAIAMAPEWTVDQRPQGGLALAYASGRVFPNQTVNGTVDYVVLLPTGEERTVNTWKISGTTDANGTFSFYGPYYTPTDTLSSRAGGALPTGATPDINPLNGTYVVTFALNWQGNNGSATARYRVDLVNASKLPVKAPTLPASQQAPVEPVPVPAPGAVAHDTVATPSVSSKPRSPEARA